MIDNVALKLIAADLEIHRLNDCLTEALGHIKAIHQVAERKTVEFDAAKEFVNRMERRA